MLERIGGGDGIGANRFPKYLKVEEHSIHKTRNDLTVSRQAHGQATNRQVHARQCSAAVQSLNARDHARERRSTTHHNGSIHQGQEIYECIHCGSCWVLAKLGVGVAFRNTEVHEPSQEAMFSNANGAVARHALAAVN